MRDLSSGAGLHDGQTDVAEATAQSHILERLSIACPSAPTPAWPPAMLPVQDPPQAVLPFSTVRLRL
jgi:hypothetical protein